MASFGPVAVAVQKVGSQIESISWMTAEGLSSSLSSFIGQNYGAKKFDRVNKGFKLTLILAIILGFINTLILVFLGKQVFTIFIQEEMAIKEGTIYLKILGYSQLFMCIEIITSGAFKGLGKTSIPSIISIIFTGLRVQTAYLISNPRLLGLTGVWWSITISSIIKGILMLGVFLVMKRKKKLYDDYNTKGELSHQY